MRDTLLRVALSPVLVTQALRVRRRAQSLPEASGPRSGTLGAGPPLRLQIVGDSSAAGVGVQTQDQALSGQLAKSLSDGYRVEWHLNAITGATTRSTLGRLAAGEPQSADVVVVALGVNDVTRLVPAPVWAAQQQMLIDRLTTLYAPNRIYLSGMPPLDHFPLLPNPLRWTLGRHAKKLEQTLLPKIAGQAHVTYMPFNLTPSPDFIAEDGFHPSANLYAIWASQLADQIKTDRVTGS